MCEARAAYGHCARSVQCGRARIKDQGGGFTAEKTRTQPWSQVTGGLGTLFWTAVRILSRLGQSDRENSPDKIAGSARQLLASVRTCAQQTQGWCGTER